MYPCVHAFMCGVIVCCEHVFNIFNVCVRSFTLQALPLEEFCSTIDPTGTASPHLDLNHAPYVSYGVEYIDLVSLPRLAGASLDIQHGASGSHIGLSCVPMLRMVLHILT